MHIYIIKAARSPVVNKLVCILFSISEFFDCTILQVTLINEHLMEFIFKIIFFGGEEF